MNVNEIDNDERTTAVGLARYAREYFDCAIAADDVVGHRTGYEVSAPAPVMFLVAHAIELALKAYLRYQGYTVADLRKVGHDLNQCLKVSVENGLSNHVELDEKEIGVLRLLNQLHTSTELRYIVTGSKTLPVFGPLQTVASKLPDAICPLVGYK